MNRNISFLSGMLAALSLLTPAILFSATSSEIAAQIDSGNFAQAAKLSQATLANNPKDRDVRFLNGVALAQLGKTNEAIQVFGRLARDFPDMPEPANNLAVLYAKKGEYEKSRRWLEAAMATHPAYATAHKNLGDIYTALAAVAYSKALEDKDTPSDLGVRLEMVSELQATPATTTTTVAAAEPTPRKKPTVVKAPEPKPEPARPPQPSTPAKPATPEPAPRTPAETQQTPATQQQPPAATADADTPPGVLQTVRAWAQAWSNQNVQAYLDTYADNFYPGDDLTLTAWRAQRRDRLSSPAFIRVEVLNPRVEQVGDDRVRVKFQQIYEADTYSDRVNKTLVLQRKAAGWRIVRELSNPIS